ncbi:MAG TPA: hypothetical protein VLK27_03360 [Chthoniobacterales bacterium]|nr:hypothetical protein [Chthoniobacterales bacterium]
MREALVLVLVVGLCPVAPLVAEEQPGNWETVTNVSPDKKFGMRISCLTEPEDPKNIKPDSITAVDLVLLPSKRRVMGLPQNYSGTPAKIFWAQDSKWFALSVSEGPRVTDTEVYHRGGDQFEKLDTEGMTVDVGGNVKNQYIEPVQWLKPAVLVVTQLTVFRGDKADSTVQFNARFEQDGRFRVTNKKKVPDKKE